MSDELSSTVERITAVFTVGSDAFERVQMVAGMAAKGAATQIVRGTLGADLAMSNFRNGKVKLRAGFDIERSDVVLHLRPKGAWVLADAGRRSRGEILRTQQQQRTTRSGAVRTRKVRVREGGRRGTAVMTPRGPRVASTYGPSRPLRVIARTAKKAEADVVGAAEDAMATEVAKAVR